MNRDIRNARLVFLLVVFFPACSASAPSQDDAFRAVAHLTAPVTMPPAGFDQVMVAWRWTVAETARPLLITALGDVFLEAESGEVQFLDTESGKVETIARSRDEWFVMLTNAKYVEMWFRPSFVNELKTRGKPLKREEVYSPIHPLILNGELTVENFTPSRWDAHLHAMGQIHRQVKDLPSGTPITKIHFNPL
jgi:hypothetical protein